MTTRMRGPDSGSHRALTVTALATGRQEVLVLRVSGEIDLCALEQLRQCLDEYGCCAYRAVVLDFTRVPFLAACGIGLLFEYAEKAHAEGVRLRLVAQHPMVLRALEVTGSDEFMPRVATVREAVAQCCV